MLQWIGVTYSISRWEIIVHPWTGLTIMLRVKFGLCNCLHAGDEKLVSVTLNCIHSQYDLHVDFATLCYHIWQNFQMGKFLQLM